MESTAYVCEVESGNILYIINGLSEDAMQDYIETNYGVYIFNEWQVCWSKFNEIHETEHTETVNLQ